MLDLSIEIAVLKSNFINGALVDGQSDNLLEVVDKFSSESLCTLTLAGESQVDHALYAAQQGFQKLKSMSAGARATGLQELASLIRAHKVDLTHIIVAEAGKPFDGAAGEVDRACITLEAAAQEAIRFCGEVVNLDHHNGEGRTAMSQRIPRGVVAAIAPFNFPLNLALHKIAPALAVGCSVILKPSPFTPLSSLYLASLYQHTSLPKTGLNVIVCDNHQAKRLVTSDAVAMVSFTGSDAVGWSIKQSVPKKTVALELGGNAAVILDQDTDIKAVTQKLIPGAFLYAGQICISTQRVYVHETQYDELLEAMTDKLEHLVIGNPEKPGVQMGPLIDSKSTEKIQSIIQQALTGGARIVAQTGSNVEHGTNVHPAVILTGTQPQDRVIQEEVFGPLCVVEKFRVLDTAIDAVNNTPYGLQVGVFSQNIAVMKQCFNQLEVGAVIMNDIPGFRVDSMPYGGVKESGCGREGPIYAMEEMTEPRLLVF